MRFAVSPFFHACPTARAPRHRTDKPSGRLPFKEIEMEILIALFIVIFLLFRPRESAVDRHIRKTRNLSDKEY